MPSALTVMVSGGFDPVHRGHLRLFLAASHYGRVVVALNSDAWLAHKKGKPFMDFEERREILCALRSVEEVVSVEDSDGTVTQALRRYRPHYFANGGDREVADSREDAVCRELGIQQLFHVGGEKLQSSSKLIERAR